ncbi:MAG: TGS domain-containing protein, partial [Methanomicrobia archaeon]|nr:TGS domain-containing protein [Methanomicrobia archaeon]
RYSEFGILSLSAEKKINIEQVKEKIYEILDIVRVFTKSPGSEPDYPPIAMKRGATILDVAKEVHKQFYKNFKYAKVWGRSVKYDGQRAGGDHVVGDGDIVEIHIK